MSKTRSVQASDGESFWKAARWKSGYLCVKIEKETRSAIGSGWWCWG